MSSLFFLTFFFFLVYIQYVFGRGLWHFGAWSAFYMGKQSPTCSCFKSPIVLHFLSIVYDVQNVAATAPRQHYFGLNQINWTS